MPREWVEGTDGASLSLELDAEDAERRDAQEIVSFVARARTPPEDAAVRGTWARRARGVALILFGFPFGAALADAVLTGAVDAGHDPSRLVTGATLLVATLLPGVLATVAGAVAEARARSRREEALASCMSRFTLSLDAGGFVLRAHARPDLRVPLSDLYAFEGDRRIVLVRANGARTALPCDLGSRDAHREIAARFGDALARVRAGAAAYRGLRVESAPDADAGSAVDHDGDDDARSRQRS